jgi:hypothetical protein
VQAAAGVGGEPARGGQGLASCPIELATNRQAMSASSTPKGSAPPANGAPTMIEKATAAAGAMWVMDWNSTSRRPMAERASSRDGPDDRTAAMMAPCPKTTDHVGLSSRAACDRTILFRASRHAPASLRVVSRAAEAGNLAAAVGWCLADDMNRRPAAGEHQERQGLWGYRGSRA